MNFSFVIPSNRPYEAIEPLLLSIQKQLLPPQEVIIVRDRQATLDERNIYHKRIEDLFVGMNFKLHIISDHNDKDFSVGKGASYVRNYGRKQVKTAYMIFVDDDNTFDNNFTEKLAQQRKNNPDSIIVPTQYDEQGQIRPNVVAHGFSFRMCRPKRIKIGKDERKTEGKTISQSLNPITLASSNCLSGPTKIFATYPFDEGIPFIYEDMLMTGQMSIDGIALLLDKSIPIYHHHTKRSKAKELYIDTPSKAYYKGKHRVILVHTLGQKLQKVIFWIMGLWIHTARLATIILIYYPNKHGWKCLIGLIRGTWDGVKTIIRNNKGH